MSFNTKYYTHYSILVAMMAWLPIFFMYFNEHLEIKHVILLESLYYLSVVILEVPSGMFSDKFGRRITLIMSTLSFLIAYLIFGLTDPGLVNFAFAQIALAGGMSFMSGTDTSFHYESLQDVGIEKEFGDKEARVQSMKQYGGAVAVLFGGFLGAVNLNLPYVASMVLMLPALVICFKFTEPSHEKNEKKSVNAFIQVGDTFSYLKVPELRWIFLFSVITYILSHIPYEFYQPYLKLLEKNDFALGVDAAIYSGILFAIMRFVGAFAAGKSVRWSNRYGLKNICLIAILWQLLVIGMMAYLLSQWVILILLFRSFSMSLTQAPLNAEIAPRVAKRHRASYFSLQSLFSRLLFSFSLILLSLPIANDIINDWPTLSLILKSAFWGGVIVSIPLILVKSGKLFSEKLTN